MTPAEAARLFTVVTVICPPQRRRDRSAQAWYVPLADLPVADAIAAVIQLARRQRDVTPADVRTEVFALRRQHSTRGAGVPPAAKPTDSEPTDSCRYRAMRVACPWCAAAPGEPCTVRGSDVRLRQASAHPLRLILAEGHGP